MSDINPWEPKPLCSVCLDFRHVQVTDHMIEKCKACGTLDDEQYSLFRRAAIHRNSRQPEICALDLTTEEFKVYQDWCAEGISKEMALSWCEGRRYDPAKDLVFLAECANRLAAWQALRGGPA